MSSYHGAFFKNKLHERLFILGKDELYVLNHMKSCEEVYHSNDVRVTRSMTDKIVTMYLDAQTDDSEDDHIFYQFSNGVELKQFHWGETT